MQGGSYRETRHSPAEINAFLLFCLLKNQNTRGTIPVERNTVLNQHSLRRGGVRGRGRAWSLFRNADISVPTGSVL